MTKKKEPVSRLDWWFWWLLVLAALLILVPALPVVPWRMSRMDTNLGNRFVMDRWYTLFGATDQFGKEVNWFALKHKIQKKSEEFGKPSPVSSLVGTVGQGLGTGGAAIGCSGWQACKDHVAQRYSIYSSVAIAAVCSFCCLLLSSFCSFGTIVYIHWEESEKMDKKKKKKKRQEEEEAWFCPAGRTRNCCIAATLLALLGVVGFHYMLDRSLKELKQTAYYPYAGAHVAPYVGGVGCAILAFCTLLSIHRVTPLCGRKGEDDGQGQAFTNEQYYAGYGAYPPGHGEQPAGKGTYSQFVGGYGGKGDHAGAYPPQEHYHQQWNPYQQETGW